MSHSDDEEGATGDLTRRALLRQGAALSAALWFGPEMAERLGGRARKGAYLEAAMRAGRWLSRAAISDAQGTHWLVDPAKPTDPQLDLYNGTTGVVPFWLELHHATGDRDALRQASAGADYLANTLPASAVPGTTDAGLYTGLAGIAWVLTMTHRATNERRHADAAARAHAMVKAAASADPSGKGVRWADSTDIISGSAGTGLYLLWAHRTHRDDESIALALRAGQALIAAGEPVGDGLRWKINAAMPREYPNFSHGTGGVAYFLTALHEATGERVFLDAALAGAKYLQSIATTTAGDGRMVHHSTPGNEQLYYLSWCHGPAGTARLFHKLGAVAKDASLSAYVDRLAAATVAMKVPERSPGFWNNISQCCGNCGVTEFFVGLHSQSKGAARLAFAERVAQDAIAHGAATEGDGMKWVQAENRVSPEDVVAQTGLMQGAAGVGLAMLHLDGAIRGRKAFVVLPDNPFA